MLVDGLIILEKVSACLWAHYKVVDAQIVQDIGSVSSQPDNTPKRIQLAVLQELDALVQPHLLTLYRDKLQIPGYLSLSGSYWISPQMGVKFGLRKRDEYFTMGLESLRAWALEQQGKPVVVPEHPFLETPEMLQIAFYAVMFSEFFPSQDYKYETTARKIWKVFRKLYGPVRTRRMPDFQSSYRMLRFLHWCLENPPQDFTVTSRIEHKSEKFTVKDLWMQPNPETLAKLKVYGKLRRGTRLKGAAQISRLPFLEE